MDAFKVEDLGYHGVATNVAPNGSDGGAKQPEQNTSPGRARSESKVELPSSCDPPGPNNPPKQLVWIVSQQFSLLARCYGSERFSFLAGWHMMRGLGKELNISSTN